MMLECGCAEPRRSWLRCRFRWIRASCWMCIVSALSNAQVGEHASDVDAKIAALRSEYEAKLEGMRNSYEGRITALEGTVAGLRGELEVRRDAGSGTDLEQGVNDLTQRIERQGVASLGQTTAFDNTFNPALSVLGDFILSASNLHDGFEATNRFFLRELELGLRGRVDPILSYQAFLHFEVGGMELEEAYGLLDGGLPDTFSLKFGRYNVDFGKQSPVHDHDLPTIDKPGVLQEYLGGALRGTGVELHHWFPLGESHVVRWSLGVINDLDGDVHAVFGPRAGAAHADEGHTDGRPEFEPAEPFGNRSFENFAFTGRLSGLFELGTETTLHVGTSVAWAPEIKTFYAAHGGKERRLDGVGEAPVLVLDLERLLWGLDVALNWRDPSTGEGFSLAGEFLLNRQRFLPELDAEDGLAGLITRQTAVGFYAYGEYFLGRNWSVGASFDWFERATDDSKTWWDAGAFVTYRVNEFNRLRLEFRYFEDDLLREDTWAVLLQWTTVLGSHQHGVDW